MQATEAAGEAETVKIVHDQGERPRLQPDADAARKRTAVETYSRNESALRRTARRYSLCADDADEALQRGLEILLRKAPTDDPRELIKWTQTVVKHEALAVRRERERILAGPAGAPAEPNAPDWVQLIPADSVGPAERAERREAIALSREALQTLKPQELRALTLLAEGYSYAEIGEITQWSRTKVRLKLSSALLTSAAPSDTCDRADGCRRLGGRVGSSAHRRHRS
jgi:RNA polymerase sigma factor (sigma-70 family)